MDTSTTFNVIVKAVTDWADLTRSFPNAKIEDRFTAVDRNYSVPNEDTDAFTDYCEDRDYRCELV